MYPFDELPKPLNPAAFYLLLALTGPDGPESISSYALQAAIGSLSLRSVDIPNGNLNRLINQLIDLTLIEMVGDLPTEKTGRLRPHYAITELGTIRLKEELQRLDFALEAS